MTLVAGTECGLAVNKPPYGGLRYAELGSECVLALASCPALLELGCDFWSQLRERILNALLVVRLLASRRGTRNPCPRAAGDCLAHRAHSDAELDTKRRCRLACSVPSAALDHDLLRESRTRDSLAEDKCAIPALVLAAVLGSRSVGQVEQPVVPTATRTVTDIKSFRPRSDKCLQDKLMHQPVTSFAVPVQGDAQVINRPRARRETKQAPSLAAAFASMEAADTPEVRDLVQPLKFRYWQPALRLPCVGHRSNESHQPECPLDKHVNRHGLAPAVSLNPHRRIPGMVRPRTQDAARHPAPSPVAYVYYPDHATDPALIADLVKSFPARHREPVLNLTAGRDTLFHGRSLPLRQGPGRGVISTVRSAITYLLIIADSLAISAGIRRGDA